MSVILRRLQMAVSQSHQDRTELSHCSSKRETCLFIASFMQNNLEQPLKLPENSLEALGDFHCSLSHYNSQYSL